MLSAKERTKLEEEDFGKVVATANGPRWWWTHTRMVPLILEHLGEHVVTNLAEREDKMATDRTLAESVFQGVIDNPADVPELRQVVRQLTGMKGKVFQSINGAGGGVTLVAEEVKLQGKTESGTPVEQIVHARYLTGDVEMIIKHRVLPGAAKVRRQADLYAVDCNTVALQAPQARDAIAAHLNALPTLVGNQIKNTPLALSASDEATDQVVIDVQAGDEETAKAKFAEQADRKEASARAKMAKAKELEVEAARLRAQIA